MIADGVIHPREEAYCKVIAKGYDFSVSIIDDMIKLFADVDMVKAAFGDRLEISRLDASTQLLVNMYNIPLA